MKKLFTLVLSICMMIQLVACGTDASSGEPTTAKQEPKEPVAESEFVELFSNPSDFKDRPIQITGKVFGDVEKDENGIYFQMWQNPQDVTGNVVVGCLDTSIELSENDYVKVNGVVQEAFEGENAFGGVVTAPMILADTVTVSSYMEIESPTLKTITPKDATNQQHKCSVTVDKIEFAEKETRVYVTAINNSKENMSFYTFNTKLVQGSSQYEEQTNYDAEYPEVASDILPEVTSSGIIAFPPIDPDEDFQIHMEFSNEDYSLDFEPCVFKISAKE